MLKQRGRTLATLLFCADLTLVAAAFVSAFWLRDVVLPWLMPTLFPSRLYPLENYLPLLGLALLIWGALLLRSGQYRSHRTMPLNDEAWALLRVTFTAAVLFALVIYAFRLDSHLLDDDLISRSWILLFATLSGLFMLSEKVAVRVTSRYVRASGYNYRTVIIVGTGDAAAEVVDSIERHPYWGFRILGFIAPGSQAPPWELTQRHPILGGIEDIPNIVENNVVDDVIFAVARREIEQLDRLAELLHEQGIRTRFALNFVPHPQASVELEDLDGIPILTFASGPASQAQLLVKRVVDLSIASLLLLVSAPMVLLSAIVIRLTSNGAVVFRQTRCGLNGRLFTLYKFRTMVEDAEQRREEVAHLNEMDGPVFKVRRDPRVTAVGRFLRKFSLDELPQLWNVIRGDMSLVGPRPPIPAEVRKYERWQRRRLAMKPGLTCLWQISGRNDIDFERWMRLDLEYIDSWSPSLDFKILLKTIPVVLLGKGAS